jgi:hypothetical protein
MGYLERHPTLGPAAAVTPLQALNFIYGKACFLYSAAPARRWDPKFGPLPLDIYTRGYAKLEG